MARIETEEPSAAEAGCDAAEEADARLKQLRDAFIREHERLEQIFDTVPLLMTIYEPSTHVLRVNRAFERLIGWSTEELAGISLMEQCYPDPAYRKIAAEYMQACRPEWREFRIRTRSNGDIESSWTNIRLADDTQLGIGVDITASKRAEAALRESEEALRRADRQKDEFLAVLAHELRNPLAAMNNALHLLRGADANPVAAEKAVSVLNRQLGLMVRLVEDMLDGSRIRTGKIALDRKVVDVCAIAQRAVENSQQLFGATHELAYEPDPKAPLLVDGDAVRLEQVFMNLLHNAAKFTPRGGMVLVAVERNDHQAIVRVRDTGIGIRAEFIRRIFDMFEQGDRATDLSHGGLGIGLNLVKRLVELHGGTVEALSAGPGQGSEFVVRLPVVA